ncbi:hypothetical protein PSH92_15555 [Pseudomonas beijingensis]|uniref:Uncharacterized protein n=2 Tax=Pseudomonas beijingensis TaxID=2954101 RepID=A0ABY9F6S1_9PSED|nr:hypothetical protein [Pseudomonas sp. FP2034]WLG98804.1 hypothetical protein PSH92_15555 [Pseudomonas sp. FP2034]
MTTTKNINNEKSFDVEPYNTYIMDTPTVRKLLEGTGHSWDMNLPSFIFTNKYRGATFINYKIMGSIGHSNKYSASVTFHDDLRFLSTEFIKETDDPAPEKEEALVNALSLNILLARNYTTSESFYALAILGSGKELNFSKISI